MKTKVIYYECLGYKRGHAILKRKEKLVNAVFYKDMFLSVIDYTESTALNPFVKIITDRGIYLELSDRLPKIKF